MAIPLLAMPIRNPLSNLLFQYWVVILGALLAPFILARFTIGAKPKYWVANGALINVIFLVGFSGDGNYSYYLFLNQFSSSICIGGIALVLLDSQKRVRAHYVVIAAFLLLVATWINNSLVLLLVPIVLSRFLLTSNFIGIMGGRVQVRLGIGGRSQGDSRFISTVGAWIGELFSGSIFRMKPFSRPVTWQILLPILAYFPNRWFAGLYGAGIYGETLERPNYGWLPLTEWPQSWWKFISVTWNELIYPRELGLIFLTVSLLIAAVVFVKRKQVAPRPALIRSGIFLPPVVLYFLLFTPIAHLKVQGYDSRYSYPIILLLVTGVAALFVTLLFKLVDSVWQTRIPLYLSSIALPLGVIFSFGFPSGDAPRSALLANTEGDANRTIELGVTHLAGSWKKVWPTVFTTNMKLYEQGSDKRVSGFTIRSNKVRGVWNTTDQERMRVALMLEPYSRKRQGMSDQIRALGWGDVRSVCRSGELQILSIKWAADRTPMSAERIRRFDRTLNSPVALMCFSPNPPPENT
jgi:hypothetical protein